jgi:hypothetical protein
MEQGRNFLAEIQALIEQKLETQSPEERMEKLNEELKKAKPDFVLIQTLLDKGVGKVMSIEKIREKFEKKSIKAEQSARLKELNAELKKLAPNMSLIESLLQKGVGKEISIEEIKSSIDEEKINSIPKEFTSFVSNLDSDGMGRIEKAEMKKLKEFLSCDIELNIHIRTDDNKSLIHIAVGMGDTKLAEMLIKRGIDVSGGYSTWAHPLYWTTSANGVGEVKELIKEELRKKGLDFEM